MPNIPKELYRRAARRTLEKIDEDGSALGEAIEALLLWRDNNWQEMEELLVEMLGNRDRWMQGFLLEREPDWDALRERLERPFAHAVRRALTELGELLDEAPGARGEALELARFACAQAENEALRGLAELAEFPAAAVGWRRCAGGGACGVERLAALVLTGGGTFASSEQDAGISDGSQAGEGTGAGTDCERERHRGIGDGAGRRGRVCRLPDTRKRSGRL